MLIPTGLSHVAMSVPDRLTISIGTHAYLNVRERADAMVCFGYEHLGIVVDSAAAAEQLWSVLDTDLRDVHLEPLSRGAHGLTTFRFRYLLPLAVEVQAFA
jgi:hypothetical protein